MYRLYLFLFKYRVALTFLFLEILCGWLIVQNNLYHRAAFFNSSNAISARLLSASYEIKGYFALRKTNEDLANEVANLRIKLEQHKYVIDSSSRATSDSTFLPYQFITAKVVNNSISFFNNYLTINKGEDDGVEPGMGVIGHHGIIGKVKYASSSFAVVTSILHSDFLVSSKVNGKVNLCSTQWDGVNPNYAKVLYVPRHINLQVGDTVSTSGFNSIFPSDIMIGTISELNLTAEAPFYDVDLKLSSDFSAVAYVQVVINSMQNEKDSLESTIDKY